MLGLKDPPARRRVRVDALLGGVLEPVVVVLALSAGQEGELRVADLFGAGHVLELLPVFDGEGGDGLDFLQNGLVGGLEREGRAGLLAAGSVWAASLFADTPVG